MFFLFLFLFFFSRFFQSFKIYLFLSMIVHAGLSLRAWGWGFHPATISMTPGYFLRRQKKDETKRSPWLFSSPPTSCIYPANYELRLISIIQQTAHCFYMFLDSLALINCCIECIQYTAPLKSKLPVESRFLRNATWFENHWSGNFWHKLLMTHPVRDQLQISRGITKTEENRR